MIGKKAFALSAAIVFSFAFSIHFLRVIYNWEMIIGGVALPMWLSWMGFILAGFLLIHGFKFSKK
jgi:hypothetical protein